MAILMRRTLMRTIAPNLEQLETNGAASCFGEVCVMQADTAQCTEHSPSHQVLAREARVGAQQLAAAAAAADCSG